MLTTCVFQVYPGPPYYKGCVFSNGPTYIDIAAGLLNITVQNFAVGGATSGAVIGSLGIPTGFANRTSPTSVDVPSSLEQVKFISLTYCMSSSHMVTK